MSDSATHLVEVNLSEHLTAAALRDALEKSGAQLPRDGQIALLVDCSRMTGYDADARALFVAWNRDHKKRIDRVAIITDNGLWHVVVSAMALASGRKMKAFQSRAEAVSWTNQTGA